jgi:hypothetical protein
VSGRRQGTTNPSDVCWECANKLLQVRRFPWSQARNLGTVIRRESFEGSNPSPATTSSVWSGCDRVKPAEYGRSSGSYRNVRLFGSLVRANAAWMRIRVPLAVPTPAGPWTSPVLSFRIEVPCDNSCDNSWPIGGNHGESRSVTKTDASRSEAQTRRSQAYGLLC